MEMWQTSGGWGRIDRDDDVEAILRYDYAGLFTCDMADHYGPAEDLYGIFINRVRQERPPEYLEKVRGWDYANTGYLNALKHLTDLKEGKIKTVPLTNFDTERLQIILENEIPVISNQVQHSIVGMQPQQKMAELCQLTGVKLKTYGTVMGGLLSGKFLDTNVNIPFAGPPLNTHSLQKYKRMIDAWGIRSFRQAVAGSMVGVRLGLSEHIQDCNAVFSLTLDEEDRSNIKEVTKKGKNLLQVIGDCGDEYRRR